MKLRVCICFLTIWTVSTAFLLFGYISVRRDYNRVCSQLESVQAGNVLTDGIKGGNQGGQASGENPLPAEKKADPEEKISGTDAFYYVTLNEKEVIAYTGDRTRICMRTEIDEKELAAALIQELKQGIYLENLPALYEYLENCSS